MRLALLLGLVIAALPSTAFAARVEGQGSALLYTAAPGDTVDLTVKAGNSSILAWVLTPAKGTTFPQTGVPCIISGGVIVTCQKGTRDRLRFVTVGGADKIDASALLTPFNTSVPEEFDTGAGDDEVVAGPLADVVRAGDGADRVTGGPGADVLDGQAGDDVFVGLVGADTVTGGDGSDVLDLSALAGGVSVSLNGLADDGPLGLGANVDVDEVLGTAFTDLLSGGDRVDVLRGGAGDDVVDVRGGGGDIADCGDGEDRAVVDAGDVPLGCETVELPPVAVPSPDDGGGGGGGGLVDGDGDGVLVPADCDDTRSDVRPGARDVPGNGLNEDCAGGGDAALLEMPARVVFEWAAFRDGSGTVARALKVRGVPAGGRVELRCTGGGCGFARRVARVSASGDARLLAMLRGRRLRAGAVVEVRVVAPEFVGKVTRFRMRRARVPVKTSLCLQPGERTPGRCG